MSRQYAYVWGTLGGRCHLWRVMRAGGYRWMALCEGIQGHRPGWRPDGHKRRPVCQECERVRDEREEVET